MKIGKKIDIIANNKVIFITTRNTGNKRVTKQYSQNVVRPLLAATRPPVRPYTRAKSAWIVSRGTDTHSRLTICRNSSTERGGGNTRKRHPIKSHTYSLGQKSGETGEKLRTWITRRASWMICAENGMRLAC